MMFLDPDFLKDTEIAAIRPQIRVILRISTSGLKSDVTIMFLDPDFLTDTKISAIRVHLRQI